MLIHVRNKSGVPWHRISHQKPPGPVSSRQLLFSPTFLQKFEKRPRTLGQCAVKLPTPGPEGCRLGMNSVMKRNKTVKAL